MKIKRYIAPTMPEAMNQIRKELGSDAVILSSKEIHEGGVFGLFKKRKIEVIAALDKKKQTIPPQPTMQRSRMPEYTPSNTKPKDSFLESEIMSEIKSMRKLLEQQLKTQSQQQFAFEYQAIYNHLLEQEVNEELATSIVDNVSKMHFQNKITPSAKVVIEDVKAEIERQLSRLSFDGISNSAKVVHFFGPTGVGKTTTLAKVAARSMLQEQKKVAFMTMDTYRIAAIEQLKTYAKILEVPVEVVYSLEDYQIAIEKFKHYDLILVDTAGRNYREQRYVEELNRNIKTKETVENYLVLSLTSKPKDMDDIYLNFRHLNIKSLIFTKIDETRQYGSLVNIPLTHQTGIAYITDGQEVPDNLFQPTKEIISNYIVGDLIDS